MNRILGTFTAAMMMAGVAAMADDQPKKELKKAGSDVKEAGQASGRATKHAAKGVTSGTKKGVNKAAGATENGAAKLKAKTTDKHN